MLLLHKAQIFRKCLVTWQKLTNCQEKQGKKLQVWDFMYNAKSLMLRVVLQMWKSWVYSFSCFSFYTLQRSYHKRLLFSLGKYSNILERGIGVILCTAIVHWILVPDPPALWPPATLYIRWPCAGPRGEDYVSRAALRAMVNPLRGRPWWEVPSKGIAGCSGPSFMSLASLVHRVLKT